MPEDISKLADLMEIELKRIKRSTNKDTNTNIYGWEITEENACFRFNVFMSKDRNNKKSIEISEENLNRLMDLLYFF